jgi:hypothetical protein
MEKLRNFNLSPFTLSLSKGKLRTFVRSSEFFGFPLRQTNQTCLTPPRPEGVKKLIRFFFASFRRKPESSGFEALRTDWTPVFTGVTA